MPLAPQGQLALSVAWEEDAPAAAGGGGVTEDGPGADGLGAEGLVALTNMLVEDVELQP